MRGACGNTCILRARGRSVASVIEVADGDDPLKRLETLSHQLDAASRAARHTIDEIERPKHRTASVMTKTQRVQKRTTRRHK
jgi:hypothetical protein